MADPTPLAWRVAAAMTLGGGAAIGVLAAGGRWARRGVVAGLGTSLAATVPIALAGRRPPIHPRAEARPGSLAATAATQPTFTIVVAARDEAAVLPRLVADVAAQDHRVPAADGGADRGVELIVIDDRSEDGTGEAVVRAAASAGIADRTRVVRRSGSGLADGKGAALTAVDPSTYLGEVVVVLDADARIAPDFLSTLAYYVGSGASALTVRRRVLDTDASWLARAQADEQTIDGELQRGRWALGGLSEFRGNGIVVVRELLLSVGGWRAEALTEDLDLSTRVAILRGHGVAWAIDAEVWEEPVRAWGPLWRQRVRWAEGSIRRTLEHGPRLLRSPKPSIGAKLDFAAYAGQIAAPPILVGAVAGSVLRGRAGTAVALLGLYGAAAAALGWDALRWERTSDGLPLPARERAERAVGAAVFGVVWLAAVPAALWRLATRRGAVVYEKMDHDGGLAGQGSAPAWSDPAAGGPHAGLAVDAAGIDTVAAR